MDGGMEVPEAGKIKPNVMTYWANEGRNSGLLRGGGRRAAGGGVGEKAGAKVWQRFLMGVM